MTELRTSRLLLRQWRDSDLEPFAAMGADPEVMRFFPRTLTREESDDLAARSHAHIEQHGFGPWALEVVDGPPFIGFVGLAVPGFKAYKSPGVNVSWRLARPHWGRGSASEAARAALQFGFYTLRLEEVRAWAALANEASLRLLTRLGMSRDPALDFDHPTHPPGHLGRQHGLFSLPRSGFSGF